MALDTVQDRIAATEFGMPTNNLLGVADGTNLSAEQRAISVHSYAGFAVSVGETVDGGDVAIFLDDATAVPSTAVFRHGAAYSQDDKRYVALWPANSKVHYIGPFAHRDDGALIIVDTATPAGRPEGVALTDRGEVLYSNGAATHFIQGQFQFGWRLDGNGAMCFTGP